MGDKENLGPQKHPERRTVIRREVQALGKTRGTSNERKERGETRSSPSQMLETWKEAQ